MFMGVLPACACGGQERASDLLELELELVLSGRVGAGNLTSCSARAAIG